MYLIGLLIWIALSAGIAYGLAWLLVGNKRNRWWRMVLAVIFLPIMFMAPLADEIVGKRQFDLLCEEANKDARILGTIEVGDNLYTPDGKWRGYGTGDDPFKTGPLADSYLRYETALTQLPKVILIQQYDQKVFEAKTGRLLAEWREYGTSGGWLSQHFEGAFLVRTSCRPLLIAPALAKQLLVFRKGETK